MRTQTSVDNTVNDLSYEIKFENCVKGRNKTLICLGKSLKYCTSETC